MERAKEFSDRVNALGHSGFLKLWKASSLLNTVEHVILKRDPNDTDAVHDLVINALSMEGFRLPECDKATEILLQMINGDECE